MIGYMTRISDLEYSTDEADMLGESIESAVGTLSSKKAKAITAFLGKWAPWFSLGGVIVATTAPKVSLARGVFRERRRLTQEKARAVSNIPETVGGYGFRPAVDSETPRGGMGSEGASDSGLGIEGTGSGAIGFGGLGGDS
jgi:hypothetical protein